jgi:hypothetical protein
MMGLGQVLKSFRDRSADFSVYDRSSGADAYLHGLGPLQMPAQGSRAGVDGAGDGAAGTGEPLAEPGPGQGGADIAPFTGRVVSG